MALPRNFALFAPLALLSTFLSALLLTLAAAQPCVAQEEKLTGLLEKKTLDAPLQNQFSFLKYSPDGNYLLAQDETGIFILTKNPLGVLFRIEAPGANRAQFTPDSASVVLEARGLRVESWSIAEKKRTSAKEIAIRGGCFATQLSSDGSTLACAARNFALVLMDAASGNELFRRDNFFLPKDSLNRDDLMQDLSMLLEDGRESEAIHLAFSPDNQYLLASDPYDSIAVNVSARAEAAMQGRLPEMVKGGFAFISADRILAADPLFPEDSGVVEFSSGLIVRRFPLGPEHIDVPTRGRGVILSPLKNAQSGVVDLATRKVILESEFSAAIDLYDDQFLAQKASGEIGLFHLATGDQESQISLPENSSAGIRAVALSPDWKWLAVSGNSRGGLWNLSTGKKLYTMRGFHASSFDHSGIFYADFPKNGAVERTIGHVDLGAPKGFVSAKVDGGTVTEQRGNYLVLLKPLGKPNLLASNISIDVHDIATGKSLWVLKCHEEAPAIVVNGETNRVLLIWHADDMAAKEEIEGDRNLRNSFHTAKEHPGEYFVKAFAADSGKMAGQLIAHLGDLSTDQGGIGITTGGAFAADDWVALADSTGHTQVYSLASGQKKGDVPGGSAMISKAAGLLVTKGSSSELDVYSMPDLKKQSQLDFLSPVIFEAFSEDGKQLFVLTGNQTTYFLDTVKLGGSPQVSGAPSDTKKSDKK